MSLEEAAFCLDHEFDPERYGAFKGLHTMEAFERVRLDLAERARARADAQHQVRVNAEQRRIEAAQE